MYPPAVHLSHNSLKYNDQYLLPQTIVAVDLTDAQNMDWKHIIENGT